MLGFARWAFLQAGGTAPKGERMKDKHKKAVDKSGWDKLIKEKIDRPVRPVDIDIQISNLIPENMIVVLSDKIEKIEVEVAKKFIERMKKIGPS